MLKAWRALLSSTLFLAAEPSFAHALATLTHSITTARGAPVGREFFLYNLLGLVQTGEDGGRQKVDHPLEQIFEAVKALHKTLPKSNVDDRSFVIFVAKGVEEGVRKFIHSSVEYLWHYEGECRGSLVGIPVYGGDKRTLPPELEQLLVWFFDYSLHAGIELQEKVFERHAGDAGTALPPGVANAGDAGTVLPPAEGATALVATVVDATALGSTAVDATALGSPAVDATALGSPAVDDSTPVNATAVDSTPVNGTAPSAPALAAPAMDASAPSAPAMDAPAASDAPASSSSPAPEAAPPLRQLLVPCAGSGASASPAPEAPEAQGTRSDDAARPDGGARTTTHSLKNLHPLTQHFLLTETFTRPLAVRAFLKSARATPEHLLFVLFVVELRWSHDQNQGQPQPKSGGTTKTQAAVEELADVFLPLIELFYGEGSGSRPGGANGLLPVLLDLANADEVYEVVVDLYNQAERRAEQQQAEQRAAQERGEHEHHRAGVVTGECRYGGGGCSPSPCCLQSEASPTQLCAGSHMCGGHAQVLPFPRLVEFFSAHLHTSAPVGIWAHTLIPWREQGQMDETTNRRLAGAMPDWLKHWKGDSVKDLRQVVDLFGGPAAVDDPPHAGGPSAPAPAAYESPLLERLSSLVLPSAEAAADETDFCRALVKTEQQESGDGATASGLADRFARGLLFLAQTQRTKDSIRVLQAVFRSCSAGTSGSSHHRKSYCYVAIMSHVYSLSYMLSPPP